MRQLVHLFDVRGSEYGPSPVEPAGERLRFGKSLFDRNGMLRRNRSGCMASENSGYRKSGLGTPGLMPADPARLSAAVQDAQASYPKPY